MFYMYSKIKSNQKEVHFKNEYKQKQMNLNICIYTHVYVCVYIRVCIYMHVCIINNKMAHKNVLQTTLGSEL